MTLARLYGRVLGQSSLAVVTEGFRSVLEEAGLLAGIYGIDEPEDLDDPEPRPGADARDGVYTGALSRVGKMFEQGRHERHWVMLAPNSDKLPDALVRDLAGYQKKHGVRFMAPSRWAAAVVKTYLGECHSVPHGVSAEFRVRPELARLTEILRAKYRAGQFHVLHFSTSAQARKGTLELLQAWNLFANDDGCSLTCVLDYPARRAVLEAGADAGVMLDRVIFFDRGDFTDLDMAAVIQGSHVVCQPSRGEAFGLVPLQALACGTPVIATIATGHSEYLSATTTGMVWVPTDGEGPLDDLPGSRGPIVRPESIVLALKTARESWEYLQQIAREVAPEWQQAWSWKASLTPFVDRLR